MTYGGLGDYDKATSFCQEAIAIEPSYAEAHFLLGWLYYAIGNIDDAFQQYDILKAINVPLANELYATIRGKTPEEVDLKYLSKKFVQLLIAEGYPDAVRYFDGELRESLPQDRLREAWWALLTQVGFFKRQIGVRQTAEQGYDIVFVTCEFDKATVDVKIVFNNANQIAGLWFVPF